MIEKYYYPGNINDDQFENRRVIFLALTGKDICKERDDIYKKYKETGEEGLEGQVDGIVTLPLNENISDSQGHNWGQADYASSIFGAASGLLGTSDHAEVLKGIASSTQQAVEGTAAAAMFDALGVRRPMINPGLYQYYQGSGLRSFKFSFTFIPENREETEQVISIVRFFKKCASPSQPLKLTNEANLMEKLSESVMLSPHTWEIFVCNNTINELMSFHKCACTEVSVTYGDSEKVSMFEDGMPKQITLSLDFAECQLQFSSAYGDETLYDTWDFDGMKAAVEGAWDGAKSMAQSAWDKFSSFLGFGDASDTAADGTL